MKIKDVINQKDAIYILSRLLKKDKAWLFLNDELEVPKEFFNIKEKIDKGYPIEYIFEEVWFYGDKFYVKEGVLIPRDDTEVVVDRAIKLINKICANKECKVVDCCTGSGVIAIEIAKHTNSKVLATDISETAIEVARKNVMLSGVQKKVKVVKANLLDLRGLNLENRVKQVKRDSFEIENFGFEIKEGRIKGNILISNPPYVENSWKKPNEYEPDIAFFGGDDGLEIVRKLILQAKELGYRAGVIEIGYNQKEILSEFLKGKVKNFEFFKDLGGNIRGVEIFFY